MRCRTTTCLAWTLYVSSGLFALSGCQGVIEGGPALSSGAGQPAAGAGAAGAGSAAGAEAGAEAGGVSGGSAGHGQTPSTVKGELSRLTQVEYAATVRQALGVDPDLSLIPVDGRVGPFTSNAGTSPDPVHPYLLAGEDVAAEVIPNRMPACEGAAVAECVRTNYRVPFERLYRRPLTDAELTRWSTMIVDLEAAGVPALDATRAMLSGVLLHPDFLFRSSLAGGDAFTNTRRLAERLSFALWDAPPDEQLETAAVGAPADLAAEASRLSGDPRATAVVARFVAQWLHVDTDLRLANPAFEASPRFREWLAFVEDALANDVPVTALITGRSGFVHRDNLDAYGLSPADVSGAADVVLVTWPTDSPRRGALGQDLIADATRHPDVSRRPIFRGRLVRASLLCDTIPPPSAALLALAGEVSDRTTDPRCASCHTRMDPIGRAFAALDPDHEGGTIPAEVLSHRELEGTYANVPALLEAVSTSRAFAECFARHWLAFFLEQPLADADDAWVAQLADAVQAGVSLRGVVEQTMTTLEALSFEVTPWCEGS